MQRQGTVQKLAYAGTAWYSTLPNVNSNLGGGHSLEALAPDKVLVSNRAAARAFPAAISTNRGLVFTPMVRPVTPAAAIGYLAIFDTDYLQNNTIYIGVDSGTGMRPYLLLEGTRSQ